jgi:hypothetical protein
MSSGRTYLSKSSSLIVFSSNALCFRVMPFLCAFFAVLEAASYPVNKLVMSLTPHETILYR